MTFDCTLAYIKVTNDMPDILHPAAFGLPPTIMAPSGFLAEPERWSADNVLLTVRSSLSPQERTQLEGAAYTYGSTPETYDVACSNGSLLRTPCGNGYANIHPDGRFWHIPGGMIAQHDLKLRMIQWLKDISLTQRRTIAVYSVGSEDVAQYREAGFVINKFGEEPVIDLGQLNWQGGSFEWVRRQTNYCKRAGLEVAEVSDSDAQRDLSRELDEIHADDLSDRVYSQPLKLLEGEFDSNVLLRRRLFVARHRETNRIEGFMAASPMEAGRAWSFETYRKRRTAPRGTMPFLFREVIDRMQSEGIQRVSLCLVPGKGVKQDRTVHSDAKLQWILSLWYSHLNIIFNTAGQDFFKSRFRPRYIDRYLCVAPHNSLFSAVSFLKTSGAIRPNIRNFLRRLIRGQKHSSSRE